MRTARRPARIGPAWAVASLVLGSVWAAAGAADSPSAAKPARKDTSARLRPKEVTATVAVAPAQAKAGETVTYRVTAQVQEPWHIYAYAKTQPAQGPRSTQFDFYDTAGLQLAGDWTASRAPIRTKE